MIALLHVTLGFSHGAFDECRVGPFCGSSEKMLVNERFIDIGRGLGAAIGGGLVPHRYHVAHLFERKVRSFVIVGAAILLKASLEARGISKHHRFA